MEDFYKYLEYLFVTGQLDELNSGDIEEIYEKIDYSEENTIEHKKGR